MLLLYCWNSPWQAGYIFPIHSQLRDLKYWEMLLSWSLHTAFLFWRLEEVSGMGKIPLCQLASEGSARPGDTVIDVATTSTWSESYFYNCTIVQKGNEVGKWRSPFKQLPTMSGCLPLALQLQEHLEWKEKWCLDLSPPAPPGSSLHAVKEEKPALGLSEHGCNCLGQDETEGLQ